MLTQRKFSDVKTHEVLVITPHAKVLDALNLMVEKQVKHIPVIEHGRMVGLVCSADTVSAILSNAQVEDATSEEDIIGYWYE